MRQSLAVRFAVGITTWILLCGAAALAQAPTAKRPAPAATSTTTAETADIDQTRAKLMELLRMDRKVTAFVARDPLLLSDREFVQRNDPALAAFLDQHPEVARNPEFYLFAETGDRRDPRSRFERQDWDFNNRYQPSRSREVLDFVVPFLVFFCLLVAVLWIIRVLMENRRWQRMLNVQTDAQNRLLDKFGSSAELIEYLRSDVDKRLLQPVGVPIAINGGSTAGSPVGRILGPLQAGIILAVVGTGTVALRGMLVNSTDAQDAFTAIGMIVFTLGVGLIIAAVAGWVLARHFGLLPERSAAHE